MMREEFFSLLRKAGIELLSSVLFWYFMAVVVSILLLYLSWAFPRIFSRKRGGLIDDCPHCGAPAGFRTFQNYDGSVSYETGAVVCSQCGAQSKEDIISGFYGITVEPADIIEKWNRRCWR